MKKTFLYFTVIIFLTAAGCSENDNRGNTTNGSQVPSAMDTMPVLHPGKFDSSSTIKTPPTNDNNVIVPDTNKALK